MFTINSAIPKDVLIRNVVVRVEKDAIAQQDRLVSRIEVRASLSMVRSAINHWRYEQIRDW